MRKFRLTTYFALNFVQDCSIAPISDEERHSLLRCAGQMIENYRAFLSSKESWEQARCLFTALAYLSDCEDIFKKNNLRDDQIWSRFYVLQGRLAQLYEGTAELEYGQFRMLG